MRATNASLRPEVIAEFPDFWPSGIAVSRSNRIFISFPRLDPTPATATLVELIDGQPVPFPDDLVNAYDASHPESRFVSIHGITMAPGNRLLALDTGTRQLDRCEPRSARLYVIDLDRNAIVHAIGFPDDVCLATSYLNDVVIDSTRGSAGYAFISDSGSSGPNGIVVVDIGSGRSWRRLSGDRHVRARRTAGFGIRTESGIAPSATPGIDGIAISPDGKMLWWTTLGTYDFYSIETDLLCDPHGNDPMIARHVWTHGPREFASDGLDTDREGRVYLTDVTNGTVQRFVPLEARFETLFHATDLMQWPDAVRLGPDRLIYITDSQLNRSPAFTGGPDQRERPYRLYRAANDADPAQY